MQKYNLFVISLAFKLKAITRTLKFIITINSRY